LSVFGSRGGGDVGEATDSGRVLEIGFDVGGTFLDCVVYDVGRSSWSSFKLLIQEDLQAVALTAVRRALAEAGAEPEDIFRIAHGTTVATNTVVERRGARVGLVTTRGFRDVLELGRQERPNVFDSRVPRPEALVPRQRRLELGEDATAEVDGELSEVISRLREEQVDALVISFVRSWKDPSQELEIAQKLGAAMPGMYIVTGSAIAPLMGEYERTSTAVVSAYVGPRLKGYLGSLQESVNALGVRAPLLVMQSNGGLGMVDEVVRRPTAAQFSGPAAGVVGASNLGRRLGVRNLVTLDVGGTSADVAVLVDGEADVTHQRIVAGLPVLGTSVSVHSIGAGGGSIAWVDGGGLLKVGPESAGANPGPACYGRGGVAATVTDAHLALGFIDPSVDYADGLSLNLDLATAALARLATQLGISAEDAAAGILAITISNVVRAVRRMTVEVGRDPREFSLMAFGGGGPLYANALIHELGMQGAVIPAGAGVACAAGLLASSLRVDVAKSCPMDLDAESYPALILVLGDLFAEGYQRMRAQGGDGVNIELTLSLDLRYRGQNHEITIEVCADRLPDDDDLNVCRAKFDRAHHDLLGVSAPGDAVECVAARARASVPEIPRIYQHMRNTKSPGEGVRDVRIDEGWVKARAISSLSMGAADRVVGPALIDGADATTVVLPGYVASMHSSNSLILERK
jgi:N-methylhydantoinase A